MAPGQYLFLFPVLPYIHTTQNYNLWIMTMNLDWWEGDVTSLTTFFNGTNRGRQMERLPPRGQIG